MSLQYEVFSYRDDREEDTQYHDLLSRIRNRGRTAISGMDERSLEILGHTMEFDLTNGFPIITERDLTRGTSQPIIDSYVSNTELRPVAGPLRQGLAEIIGFINGARTQEELESFGCNFWKPWTSNPAKAAKRGLELGDLGPGSYGAAFHDFPTSEGEPFNQYHHLIEQIKVRPELRTHIITPFIPQYISRSPEAEQKVLVVPCHGMQHYNINTQEGTMSLVHWQRSCDAPIGLPFNLVHYGALLMMVAQVTGYKPDKLVFQISNGHIYEPQINKVDELLERAPFPFPRLFVDPSITKLEDFRVEHFKISDYSAHPPVQMGGAVV